MTTPLPARPPRLSIIIMKSLAKANSGLWTTSSACGQGAELMSIVPDTPGRFARVTRLYDAVQRTTDHVVACAHAARQPGATAEFYRSIALDLDRQADRAETLLFSQAVATFRAAAAESGLIADALAVIESKEGL